MELLEDRRLLSTDLLVGPLPFGYPSVFSPMAQRQPAMDVQDGEMLFLAAGPHPSQMLLEAPHNVDAADTTNTEWIQPGGNLGLNLTGAGYTVGVWEAGNGLIRDTHQEFGGRVTVVDTGSVTSHGTHVAGTIGGAGIVASAEGMATQVDIRSRTSTDDYAEMAADASLIDVSNHSYGLTLGWVVTAAGSAPGGGVTTPSGSVDVWWEDRSSFSVESPHFGKYTADSQDLDAVLHGNPDLLSVWSAGNDRDDLFTDASTTGDYVTYFSSDPGSIGWSGAGWYLVPNSGSTSAPAGDGNGGTGYDTLASDQVAKNSLVVGAVSDVTIDPYTSGSITATTFSSYGPTDDGRIKPDVVGNGASLYSADSISDTAYTWKSGTSMSAPNVAGTSVLLIERYEDLFGTTPQSATTKALLIHTAADAGTTGPDYAYGWGLVDGAAAARFLESAAHTPDSWLFMEEGTYSGTELTWTVDAHTRRPVEGDNRMDRPGRSNTHRRRIRRSGLRIGERPGSLDNGPRRPLPALDLGRCQSHQSSGENRCQPCRQR